METHLVPESGFTTKHREATSSDKITIEVDGKKMTTSMDEASARFEVVAAEVTRLAAIEKELNNNLKNQKTLTEKDVEHNKKLESEKAGIVSDLALRKKFEPLIGAAEDAKKENKGNRPTADSLVAVGNFLGTSRNQIETLAVKQVELLSKIERNTRKSEQTSRTIYPSQ